jgi:hypothetical protein
MVVEQQLTWPISMGYEKSGRVVFTACSIVSAVCIIVQLHCIVIGMEQCGER